MREVSAQQREKERKLHVKNYDECINSPCQTRHRLKGCILYSFWDLCFKLSCEALKQNNRCKRDVPVPFYDILLLGV